MTRGMTHRALRRVARGVSGCLLAGAMSVPLGPTTTGRAVDQMNSSSMRGVRVLPAPGTPRPDTVWVPDQYRPIPGHPGGVHIPGHWEQVTSDGHRIVPPLTVTVPGAAGVETLPRESP